MNFFMPKPIYRVSFESYAKTNPTSCISATPGNARTAIARFWLSLKVLFIPVRDGTRTNQRPRSIHAEHGRRRSPRPGPIGPCRRQQVCPPAAAKVESDQAAFLCRPATALVCNPKTSTVALPAAASSMHRSSLARQSRKDLTAGRLDQCVVIQRPRRINILCRRHDVIVTGQYDRHASCHQFSSMFGQAVKPS